MNRELQTRVLRNGYSCMVSAEGNRLMNERVPHHRVVSDVVSAEVMGFQLVYNLSWGRGGEAPLCGVRGRGPGFFGGTSRGSL